MSEFNLLVLGQTGVGKSTWINSLANNLTYQTFDEALKAKRPICLIPSTFYLPDENFKDIKVSVGPSDDNERTGTAFSSTQAPKVYSFKYKNATLNVIDVPGIGDCSGVEKDSKNIKAILNTVALFKELHAVCILIKATDNKMNTSFRYCLSELLMHLHKNALNNTVFVITNTRGSDYRPGDSLTALRQFLENLKQEKGINVPLDRDTIYCIDNEAFRFQCAHFQHRQFRDVNSEAYEKSWDKSREATFRLIERMKHLRPHKTQETLSINEARAIILTLTPPLAIITGIIQNNSSNFQNNFKEIVAQIQANVAVSEYDIQFADLDMPRTVCTEKKCITVQKIAGTNQFTTYFKQICHRTCHLTNVQLNIQPEPGLANCKAMRRQENCQECGCHHRMHMHIKYDQQTVLKRNAISERLASLKRATSATASISLKNILNDLEKEQRVVTETLVQFGAFLSSNAILEYNNNVEEWINMEIRKNEAIAETTNSRAVIDRLEAVKKDYKKQHKDLNDTIKQSKGKSVIGTGNVVELQRQLFSLPLYGEKLKELYNKSYETNVKHYGEQFFVQVPTVYMPNI
uniref:G domain-containing protein n=1 Tax=Panagrolaimus sp. ES5 TaxID=591445 RepID=A0AC34FEW1_9BILA